MTDSNDGQDQETIENQGDMIESLNIDEQEIIDESEMENMDDQNEIGEVDEEESQSQDEMIEESSDDDEEEEYEEGYSNQDLDEDYDYDYENRNRDDDEDECDEENDYDYEDNDEDTRRSFKESPKKKASYQRETIIDSKMRVRKFSDQIRNELERKFLVNNFISGAEKTKLAQKLRLTERQVQKWFVHRREKLRRLQRKAAELQNVVQMHTKTTQNNHYHKKKLSTAKKSTNSKIKREAYDIKLKNEDPDYLNSNDTIESNSAIFRSNITGDDEDSEEEDFKENGSFDEDESSNIDSQFFYKKSNSIKKIRKTIFVYKK